MRLPRLTRIGKLVRGAGFRRAIWALGNEGLDAASNLFLSVWVARQVTASEFGAFGLVLAIVQFGTILCRTIANVPMMIAYGNSEKRFTRGLAGQVLGTSLAIGLGLGVVTLGYGLTQHDPVRSVALAFGIVMPGLMLQDCCVYLFYSRQRPQLAMVNNAVWATAQVAFFLVAAYAFGAKHAWPFALLWGAAAYLAVAVSLVQLRTLPHLHRALAWWREHRSKIRDLVTETAVGQVGRQGVVWLLGGLLGLTAVAGFRAGQVPLGMVRLFVQGISPMALTEGVRLYHRNRSGLTRLVNLWSAGGVVLTGMVAVFLLLLPEHILAIFLGQSWSYARPIVIPLSIAMAANTVVVPAQTGLRAFGATRESARVRVPITVAQLLGVTVGALAGGLFWATVGFAAASVFSAVMAIRTYQYAFNHAPRRAVVGERQS